MKPEINQLFGILGKIRELLLKAGSECRTGTMYQEAIARFVFGNRQLGGPIIDVGYQRDVLTAQLAFMAKTLGSHVSIVDISQERLSQAKSLLEELHLNTHASYHQGTLASFARDERLFDKPLLLAINGNRQCGSIVEDLKAVRTMDKVPYAVAVHGFGPENPGANDGFIEKTIYDCFGQSVNFIKVTHEGVILFPSSALSPQSSVLSPPSVGPEARKTHGKRFETGFYERYMTGQGLDVGFSGYGKGVASILPGAVGVDLDYPGYDGKTLPFADNSQDYVFSSHVLEHIPDYRHAIRDWHRVIRSEGHIIIIVPHQFLYEKRTRLPSAWNPGHKRFYTPDRCSRK